MELARKLSRDALAEEQITSGAQRPDPNKANYGGLDKVLRLSVNPKDQAAEARSDRSAIPKRDLAAALDLVHQAAEAIRVTENRAQDMELRTRALADRATEELRLAEGRLQAAEARARAFEERAQQAEARAQEAEEWLKRIHDVIVEELPPRQIEDSDHGHQGVQYFERSA